MRELGRAMEQIRGWFGFRRSPVDRLNVSIRHLYPDAPALTGRIYAGPSSTPRILKDSRLLAEVEAGRNTSADERHWLSTLVPRAARRVGAVPDWLVRAYDHAFHADGYLLDMHRWAVAAQREQEQLRSASVAAVPLAELTDRMLAGFKTAPDEIKALLEDYTLELARRRSASIRGEHEYTGVQLEDDGSTGMPEGTVLPQGGITTIAWTFRNPGPVAWEDCVLVRVNGEGSGLLSPPFIPVALTRPNGLVTVTCPIRASDQPGTFRAYFKLARADGTWWAPGSFVGVFATIIVPSLELGQDWQVWPTDDA